MLSYGQEALDGTEVVQQLYRSSLRVYKHLITLEQQRARGNVVAFG